MNSHLISDGHKVTVIICTYNPDRLQNIVKLITSLEQQTYPLHEIILVIEPNSEYEKKLRYALPPFVSIIMNYNKKCLSDARNAGIKAASGDILAFIDDDAIADKYWLEKIIQNYEDDAIIGVGGKIIPIWEGKPPDWFPMELGWIIGCSYSGLPLHKAKMRNIIGCNMSFRSTLFKKIGLFSNLIGRININSLGGEETEFCLRANRIFPNNKIIYDPTAIVYHNVPKTRQTYSFLLKRAIGEGISISCIRQMYDDDITKTEKKYAKFIMIDSIVSYIKRINDNETLIVNMKKIFIIYVAVVMTSLSFILHLFILSKFDVIITGGKK